MNKIFKFILITVLAILLGNGCEPDPQTTSTTPSEPEDFGDNAAMEFVKGIRIGWNLGNTLDANPWDGFNPNSSIGAFETLWVKHVTNKSNIDAIKNAGFNAIRIPVSWAKVTDSNFVIRKAWMDRVTEIVNYAAENDMYILLNTHHDEHIFGFSNSNVNESLIAFEKIWEQIADNFKNYNEKLIFEGLNEPRVKGSANEWTGGTAEERANLNKYYKVFVETVRRTGGNNDKRFLLINTYAASADQSAIDGLVLPEDTAENKLIVSIHSYSPYNFALNKNIEFNKWSRTNSSDTSQIRQGIDRAYDKFVSKGIPVIIGEFGAMNKNNDDARAQWAEYYVWYAKSKGMPCFWWDNASFTGDGENFGLLNRTNNTIQFPKVLEGLMKGLE